MRHTSQFLRVLVAFVSFVATAHAADEIGAAGTVAAVQVNAPPADTNLSFHGQLTVKNSDGVLDSYRWGGVSCGTRILSESEVGVLLRALGDKKTRILPIYQIGQADIHCVVGFQLVAKSFAKDVAPPPVTP